MDTATIRNRKSVRTYREQEIPADVLHDLQAFLDASANPFQIPITFRFLDLARDNLKSPMVSGAKTYIGGKYRRQENGEIAFGYAFERFILYATSKGLGTVWLAGTIGRKGFERAMDVQDGEVMPCVTPIGYAADKRSVKERALRFAIKADTRLPFEELFFTGDFLHPLCAEGAGEWAVPLEMVRLAPSATNKQPWRVVVCGDAVHFYEQKTKGYDREALGDIQKIDLGIALCHFEIGAKETGIVGRFVQEAPAIDTPEQTEYIVTFVREK